MKIRAFVYYLYFISLLRSFFMLFCFNISLLSYNFFPLHIPTSTLIIDFFK
ncbi:hypothetical protein BAPKO_0033 [Borreliella afzelii PKo]|nr:hypothetical protein BAPKO_0033 [Borreliella afzelii PKo]